MSNFNGFGKMTQTALILACFILMTVSAASAADMKLSVQITEPFEVNGEVHPAGTLLVKKINDYNPTQTMNELWLGGKCLGYIIAQKAEAEVIFPVRADTMFFIRSDMGHLVLAGYVLRGDDNNQLYRCQHKVQNKVWVADLPASDTVLIAGYLR